VLLKGLYTPFGLEAAWCWLLWIIRSLIDVRRERCSCGSKMHLRRWYFSSESIVATLSCRSCDRSRVVQVYRNGRYYV